MKKIVVVDFDKTLLPYDSLRYYVLSRVKIGDLRMLCYIFLRKMRFLTKKHFSYLISKHFSNTGDVTEFVNKICQDIDIRILSKVSTYADNNDTEIILLSASPAVYIEEVARKIGFVGYGSHYINGKYFYLCGENKLKFILEKYPVEKYRYIYSISDSETDLPLLSLFEKYDLLTN
ncbi:MAG: HAD family hydrolase [Paludibacteraceae bacterium]|nr:HAD family hydrolase [Paludibacteraceae bacterium]